MKRTISPAKTAEYNRRAYLKNLEKRKAALRQYYYDNIEKVKERMRQYSRNNAEACRKRASRWNKAHPGECQKRSLRWRALNPEKARNHRLKRNNWTVERYNQKFLEQNDCCAICGGPWVEGKTRMSGDHNHNTKEPRGLLCGRCNTALERLDNIPDWAQKALEYLQRYDRGVLAERASSY